MEARIHTGFKKSTIAKKQLYLWVIDRYYYGARYYASWLGRWVSADPKRENEDGLNLYAYVRNNPILRTDQNGMDSSTSLKLLVNKPIAQDVLDCKKYIGKPAESNSAIKPISSRKDIHENRRDQRDFKRAIESDRRIRREEGGSDRDRGSGGDFSSDWVGRTILERYLTGRGDLNIDNNANWSNYMMKSPTLRSNVIPIVDSLANAAMGQSKDTLTVNVQTSMEMENGEGIVGWQYLHGTESNAGGFEITGTTVRKTNIDSTSTVNLNLSYTWNDNIDPNPIYSTDRIKSAFAEIITFGKANPYEIHVAWEVKSTKKYDKNGNVIKNTGWPLTP